MTKMIIEMKDGMIRTVSADVPGMKVMVVDYDTEGLVEVDHFEGREATIDLYSPFYFEGAFMDKLFESVQYWKSPEDQEWEGPANEGLRYVWVALGRPNEEEWLQEVDYERKAA